MSPSLHRDGRADVTVLISGRGSNLSALIEATRDPAYPARITHVISNRPEAGGLEIARAAGIATSVVDHKQFSGRAAFEAALEGAIARRRADVICLAGFMRLLSAAFVNHFRGRIINIHPSLLPAFKGLKTHAQALAAGATEHGCTVHFVEPDMDAGPIIAQARVPVLPGDDEVTLEQRVLEAEHALYPRALKLVAEGAARYENGRTIFTV